MLSWLDLVAIGAIVVVIIRSHKEGLVKNLLDLFAIFVGVYAASYVCDSLTAAKVLKANDYVAFSIVFTIAWLVSFILIEIFLAVVQKIIKITIMGSLDGIGGMVLGIFKALLLVAIVTRLMSLLPMASPWDVWVEQSVARQWTLPVLEQTYTWVFHQLPKTQTLFKDLPTVPEKLPGKNSEPKEKPDLTKIKLVPDEVSEQVKVIPQEVMHKLLSVEAK
jgi:membrane protein required for colicin V production